MQPYKNKTSFKNIKVHTDLKLLNGSIYELITIMIPIYGLFWKKGLVDVDILHIQCWESSLSTWTSSKFSSHFKM